MSPPKMRRSVIYLHHTPDRDGDVGFYFLDQERGGDEPLRSSPVTGIRRFLSASLDLKGRAGLSRYIITTQNTEYQVDMAREKADHLAAELGGFLHETFPPEGKKPP